MVVPVGPERGDQVLERITKLADGSLKRDMLADVRFVPMVEGMLPEEERRATRSAGANG
jgi:protein-L-isoaspartate(D-aspartate) O-methyltransferase